MSKKKIICIISGIFAASLLSTNLLSVILAYKEGYWKGVQDKVGARECRPMRELSKEI